MRRATTRLITFILAGAICLGAACSGCDPEPTQNNSTTATTPPDETCDVGTKDCPCDEGACGDGLVCEADICVTEEEPEPMPTPMGLVIDSEQARACELLIEESDAARVLSATYGAGTIGALRRRAPRVAIAVSRADDTPFDKDSVALEAMGAPDDLNLTARCFDGEGSELPDAAVTLR